MECVHGAVDRVHGARRIGLQSSLNGGHWRHDPRPGLNGSKGYEPI
jgi:hypothetical protein